jgi:SpoVK/Ycf46/Vps4 family AAA+-type ATPase
VSLRAADEQLPDDAWRVNQHYLMAHLAVIRHGLEARVGADDASLDPDERDPAEITFDRHRVLELTGQLPPLDRLVDRFGLSPFERDVLLLCAGVELDGRFVELCARLQNGQSLPTFGLALATVPNPQWGAVLPNAPLRKWRLVQLAAEGGLTHAELSIDERILHLLTGFDEPDEQLRRVTQPAQAPRALVDSHARLAIRLAGTWLDLPSGNPRPVLHLGGQDVAARQAVAAAACAELGLHLRVLVGSDVPTSVDGLDDLVWRWDRETLLGGPALLIDCDQADAAEMAAVRRLVEKVTAPLMIASTDRPRLVHVPLVSVDVDFPTPAEQQAVWRQELGKRAGRSELARALVGQFRLSALQIQSACASARGLLVEAQTESQSPTRARRASVLTSAMWESCRTLARPHLDDLAQRIELRATWDDLVLADDAVETLRQLAGHVRHHYRVVHDWGFGMRSSRSMGTSALFAGPSGTGKTMAAEVLASHLRLDLYRVDLSGTVSKYIGETEKNLRRIFDAAEQGGVVLLFDEADALFGKRSEVKDSRDRYANIEVSYLLQRMEQYSGLAILTTNREDDLDPAFARRLRFIIRFPFPDTAQRAEIWRRVFPPDVPTASLDYDALARLNVSGGNIHSIALNAAYLAASDGSPISMDHLRRAARTEYHKLKRPLSDLAAWPGAGLPKGGTSN